MDNIVKLPIGNQPRYEKLPVYNQNQIVDEVLACPYCGNITHGRMCCGEVHSEVLYEFDDGEFLLASEVYIEREINEKDKADFTLRLAEEVE